MTRTYAELEEKLRFPGVPLPAAQPGDWRAEHEEPGQTFSQYIEARPVRRGETLRTIYLSLVGDFSEPQRRILELTQQYLAAFFDVPVQVHQQLSLAHIPARAQRIHPTWGDPQVLTSYIFHDILEPRRPPDALAHLALTSCDLWPGASWNFVFGEAHLRQRTGVWSIYRNGNPGEGEAAFRLCLRRTLDKASHELCHILGMLHCVAFRCLMNGSNHQAERDRVQAEGEQQAGDRCGAKSSTSDLLIANCDEFIYYDDLIRAATKAKAAPRGKPEDDKKQEASDRVLEILTSIEQDYDPLWGSTLKQAIRRIYPGFNEGYYGYRTFSDLLEDLKEKELIELEYDESRGNYVVRRRKA